MATIWYTVIILVLITLKAPFKKVCRDALTKHVLSNGSTKNLQVLLQVV